MEAASEFFIEPEPAQVYHFFEFEIIFKKDDTQFHHAPRTGLEVLRQEQCLT